MGCPWFRLRALVWPQATVITADGFTFQPERPADAVVVNAGVSHLSPAWLDALAAGNGRLLVPLTGDGWWLSTSPISGDAD